MKVIVIMAGGAGERFWPLSRHCRPKQLLKLTGSGQSLLEEAVERAKAIVPPTNIYVATSRHLQQAIQDANLGIPSENIIAEPAKRNTAGCLIYAAATILARANLTPTELTLGILTADHRIPDTVPFVNAVSAALDAAEQNDALVTIGIQPTRPETGYGYLEVAESDKNIKNAKNALKVAAFHEKPSAQQAASFIASGNYLWNSGMFFWRISTFQNEFGRANAVMAQTMEDLTDALMDRNEERAKVIFDALPNISIDYALMEKAKNVMVIPGKFVWDDIGSWDSLDRTMPKDNNGNVQVGEPILLDCKNCIVYNETGQQKLSVGVVGMKDVIIVVKNDSLLILPKDRAQEVRKVVVALRDQDSEQL